MKQLFFTLLICLTFIPFISAQEKTDTRKWYQDPRMMNVGPVDSDKGINPTPGSVLNYVNKNTSVMVQNITGGSAIVYPNFRVHPSTTVQSEVPIVTHPTNKNIMFGSSNAIHLDAGLFISEGLYVTTDGGTNWFGCDTTKAAPISDHGGDPAPSIDMNGRFYQSYLSSTGNGVWVSNSTDYGNTWAAATKIISGSQDKNHTFTINNESSPYNGRTFVIWSRFTATSPPIAVSYTSDNGTTWSSFKDINVSDANHFSQGCNGAVAPNGDIYVTWQNPITASPSTGDYVGFGKSTDGGATWTYKNNIYDCNGIRGVLKTSQIRVNDFPWMAVDKSGGSRNGWIYIVTAEKNLAPAGADPDIILHKSTDGGTTWSAGVRVNQDALNNGKDQYMPCINVDAVGAVNVVYYDNRNTTADSTQVFISRSIDGGTTWSDVQVSDHSFKPVPITGTATGYQGDYIGITDGANGTVWPFWADNSSGIYQAWTAKVVFATYPLNAFNLKLPASGTTVASISKGSGIINFTWDTSASTATYRWTFGSPTLATPKLAFNINTNSLSFNANQLDTILAALGMNQGDSLVGQWSVMAYRNNLPINDSLQAANAPRAITLKRAIPQLIAFDLNIPGNDTTISTSIFNYSGLTFKWNRSGDGTRYRFKFGQVLTSPKFDFPSGNGGYDTSWSTSVNILDQMLQGVGLATGDSIQGVWAIYAYSGNDSLKSSQSYNLTFKRLTKGEFLVVYDSTQVNGITSRDSVVNNLRSMNRTYDVFNKGGNISANVISFRGYKYLIWLGEGSSVMSNIQKDSIKAYLNAGAVNGASKSKLILFSEDVGYELDRPTSPYQDTAFSKGMLGIEFVADRPASGPSQSLIGDAINSTVVDSTIGSWPDVLKTSWLGGNRLYGYSTTYMADTGCGIGRIGTQWNTAVFGTDLRALRDSYKSPAGSPVNRILKGVLGWVDETAAPGAPTLVYPANNDTLKTLDSPVLTWIAGVQAKSYRVQVATDVNFTALFKDTVITGLSLVVGSLSHSGKYYWRVYSLNTDNGTSTVSQIFIINLAIPTGINKDISGVPYEFKLMQNYPNPFNPSTSIKYVIPHEGKVSLTIFNILGEKVATLVNQYMYAGNYEIKFDASHYASGIYF
ncbi:MAG: hypothetical protein P4L35_16370, partial [Ignavibacteriaceae bacterium]|nr:hypothetical protein [Ignavibacteriaceae bacterium]